MKRTTLLIESSSAKLFTTVYSLEHAESIIVLHGGPGVPMDFSPVAEQLSGKYQVISFDQRGTGRSPVKNVDYSIDEYLKDLDSVCNHFRLSKFHLFGHSWGGLYAQIYAERNQERILSLFLSSPSSGTGEVWKQTEKEVMSFNKRHTTQWGWTMMGLKSLLGMLGSDRAYQSLFKQVLNNYNREFDPSFTATDAMVENVRAEPINKTRLCLLTYPLLSKMVNCPFPVMIAYGEKDIYGESQKHVLWRFPEAVLKKFWDSGHIAWKHSPERFNEILAEFYKLPAADLIE